MSTVQPVPLFFYIYNVARFEALLRNFRNCISWTVSRDQPEKYIWLRVRAFGENLRASWLRGVHTAYGSHPSGTINRPFDTRDLVKYAMTRFILRPRALPVSAIWNSAIILLELCKVCNRLKMLRFLLKRALNFEVFVDQNFKHIIMLYNNNY